MDRTVDTYCRFCKGELDKTGFCLNYSPETHDDGPHGPKPTVATLREPSVRERLLATVDGCKDCAVDAPCVKCKAVFDAAAVIERLEQEIAKQKAGAEASRDLYRERGSEAFSHAAHTFEYEALRLEMILNGC